MNPQPAEKAYAARYGRIARKIYELGGGIDDVAAALATSPAVLETWECHHPEFAEAVRAGKDVADDRVEASLHLLCAGYNITAEKLWAQRGRVFRQPYLKKFFRIGRLVSLC